MIILLEILELQNKEFEIPKHFKISHPTTTIPTKTNPSQRPPTSVRRHHKTPRGSTSHPRPPTAAAMDPAAVLLVVCAISAAALAKIYKRCELARELLHRHEVPRDQVATWVCIALHESNLDTAAFNSGSKVSVI